MSLFKNVGSVEIYFEIAGRGYTVPPGKVISLGDEFDYVPEPRGLPLEMVDECAPGDKVPSVSLAEVKLASVVEDDLPGGDADTIMKVRNAAARSKRK